MMRKWLWLLCLALGVTGCGLFGAAEGVPTAVPVEPAPTFTLPATPVNSTPIPSPTPPAEPLPEPTATPLPAAPTVPPSNQGQTINHTVSEGEWLLQIARCYGASYAAVRQANPALANPNFIVPGSVVIVPNVGSEGEIGEAPCVQRHTVAAGESWESLAQQFGSDAATLQRVNPGPLAVGRSIFVPR